MKMQDLSIWILGIVFIGAGIAHFIVPEFYLEIMPPYLPYPLTLVYLSGVAELIGGLGILVPRLRKWAGYWLILVMVGVFPANLHMALNTDQFPDIPAWGLYARLPMQLVIIGVIYWVAIRNAQTPRKEEQA